MQCYRTTVCTALFLSFFTQSDVTRMFPLGEGSCVRTSFRITLFPASTRSHPTHSPNVRHSQNFRSQPCCRGCSHTRLSTHTHLSPCHWDSFLRAGSLGRRVSPFQRELLRLTFQKERVNHVSQRKTKTSPSCVCTPAARNLTS